MEKKLAIKDEDDLRMFLAKNYMNQIKNYFGDEKNAMKFLSSLVSDVQRNPRILDATPQSIINSYMIMASLGLMPSGVSGEAYVVTYNNSKQINGKWEKVLEAQFQLGYQGLVTLFYRAGIEKISSGIVRKNDKATFVDGDITHEIDMSLSRDERGEPIGAYVKITYNGMVNTKYMNSKDIIAHAKKFSKSYDPVGKNSPWNPQNDPELWMWIKTVLKQHSKLLPKNETINKAIALDNQESRVADVKKLVDTSNLQMGNLLKSNDKDENDQTPPEENESQDQATNADDTQAAAGTEDEIDLSGIVD